METYRLPDGSGFAIATIPQKPFLKRWEHKLFHCPTFWKMLFGLKKKYSCPRCNATYLCYWDGNDVTGHGTNFCNTCANELENTKSDGKVSESALTV